MGKQKIRYSQSGARAQRILEAVTPLTGTTAPAVNADYIGQMYVDATGKAAYISVAVGSEVPANDWEVADAGAVLATLTPIIEALDTDVEALNPLTGIVAPAEHADFVGQTYVDTVTKKVYIAVATDSAAVTDDWKEITFVS
jgi:hypothetical protein